jgi:predicted metal-dependent peptidase
MTTITNPAAAKALSTARSKLLLNHSFFGMLALRLQLVESPEIPTLAVDGRKIYYNPGFVLTLSPELMQAALAHEVMHCALDHIQRRGDRNPKKWNFAGDYAINQILQDSGFEIGHGWLLSPTYKNMTADQIYSMLPEDPSDGSGGQDALDEIMPGDPTDIDTLQAEWQVATIQAANVAKAQGKLPGSLNRFVDGITAPKVDWRAQLQRFFTSVSKDDYSWVRPNKRFLDMGIYMPSLYSEAMGPAAIAIDTSGSISNEILQAFGAEIRALVGSARPSETHVIYCDAAVNHVDKFSPDDYMEFKPHGGGGTDFRPPFDYLEQNGIRPEVFVYLTDMYGPFPDDPGYPTIWCATTSEVAPFGQTIPIEV